MTSKTLLPAALFMTLACTRVFAADNAYAKLTADARAANAAAEPIAAGKFAPTWESLKQYEFPDWFRDAKFGIWAHWGAQCEPEMGDWYARNLYRSVNTSTWATPVYRYHVEHYGHPSIFGFKDVIPLWTALRWAPDDLVGFYQKSGARYFMAMANHHDNFDNWDSKYQPWNSANLGPKKDLIAGWAAAAKKAGLPFGVSVHAGRTKVWFDVAKGADKDGPLAGVPYDGLATAEQGRGKWWDGLDPQDLYAQTTPMADYNRKFYNRTIDLINRTDADLIYFDDDYTNSGLPLYNSDPSVGLRIAAHFYNTSLQRHGGKLTAVIAAKKITPERRKVLGYDIERGGATDILPQPWQTDTCIGQWHYSKPLADRNGYKPAAEIIRMLADTVSKNGNLMLNIPVRADGTIDDHERAIVAEIGAWLTINGEAIYATRPWKIFGEGPATENAAVAVGTGEVIEKKVRPLGAGDIRFTTSKDGLALYALVLGWPGDNTTLTIKSLTSETLSAKINSVHLLGHAASLPFQRTSTGLSVTLPAQKPCDHAIALKIE